MRAGIRTPAGSERLYCLIGKFVILYSARHASRISGLKILCFIRYSHTTSRTLSSEKENPHTANKFFVSFCVSPHVNASAITVFFSG